MFVGYDSQGAEEFLAQRRNGRSSVRKNLDILYKGLPDYLKKFFRRNCLGPYSASKEIYHYNVLNRRHILAFDELDESGNDEREYIDDLAQQVNPVNRERRRIMLKKALQQCPSDEFERAQRYLAAALNL